MGMSMNLELNNINKLPVRTWSWLAVNDTSLKNSVPDIKPYAKEPLKSSLEVFKSITSDYPVLDIEMRSIPTGAGEEAVKFVEANKNSGVRIRVPAGSQVKEPVYLEYELDQENSTVVDLNHIIAEEGSSVTVVMVYRSNEGCSVFHSGLTYLYAGENAEINLIQVQLLNDQAIHLNNIGARLTEGGNINIIQAELGSLKAVSGIQTDLKGDNSKIGISTIFYGDKNRSSDFNYIVNHIGRQTISEMDLNGALSEESSKVFRGTIDFKKGAVGAIGHEKEYTLLLSPKIKNVSAPLILCGEENVEGKHAANSGKIDENKLFYMMSRGLDELTAKKLILEAWFEPVIGRIPAESLKDDITEFVKERLNHV